jgi:inner membrane protein
MDPLSQAVVGAATAGVVVLAARRPEYLRASLLVGAIGGLVPDLDVLIRSEADPLLGLKFHRHFTHSLVMAPVVGILAGLLSWLALWLWAKVRPNWRWIWLLATVGVATHGPLDSLTNYGTHLFWPFTERRENWNIISIIDPVFTLGLLFLLVLAAVRQSGRVVLAAFIFMGLYFALGTLQHQRAVAATEQLALSRGHQPARILVNPTLGNQLAWRIVYEYEGKMYSDGVHLGPAARVYEGSSAQLYRLPEELLPEDSQQARDFAYFNFFTQGWLVQAPGEGIVLKDARFAALPTEIGGFWGIALNPAEPETHIRRVSFSGRDLRQWPLLKAMILGRGLPVGEP